MPAGELGCTTTALLFLSFTGEHFASSESKDRRRLLPPSLAVLAGAGGVGRGCSHEVARPTGQHSATQCFRMLSASLANMATGMQTLEKGGTCTCTLHATNSPQMRKLAWCKPSTDGSALHSVSMQATRVFKGTLSAALALSLFASSNTRAAAVLLSGNLPSGHLSGRGRVVRVTISHMRRMSSAPFHPGTSEQSCEAAKAARGQRGCSDCKERRVRASDARMVLACRRNAHRQAGAGMRDSRAANWASMRSFKKTWRRRGGRGECCAIQRRLVRSASSAPERHAHLPSVKAVGA
mmetsp:Transcript_43810/g.110466  ORF Transcript_43810/g.110466 Transcript_43810/m.110466 type:complete len:295 (-) Transcript_43810:470-1354(-)